jgi:hypothetical protein
MAVIASFVAATARVSDARGAPTNIANSLANNAEAYNIHVTADDIKHSAVGPAVGRFRLYTSRTLMY